MSAIAGLILHPLVAGALAIALRGPKLRTALVAVTGLGLVGLAGWLLWQGPQLFSPTPVLGIEWSWIVTVADFALLALILKIGVARRSWQVLTFTVLQAVPLVWLEFFAHPSAPGPVFSSDTLAMALVLVAAVVGTPIVVFALRYMPEHEHHLHLPKSKQPRFFLLLLAFLGAMNGIALSNHLLWLYFFWEVTTLCSFFLISHDGTDEAKRNGTRALWMNSLGGAAFVFAMVALQLSGRPLELRPLLEAGPASGLALVAVSLLCLAGFTKAAQMPFQGWLLGAMVAPTPVSALLHSSTMVKAGVFLVIRLSPVYVDTPLSHAVTLVGAFTFLATAALAVGQSNAKRVLAYSTISNLGLIVLCAGLATPAAIAAAILLLLFHAISKALLFLTVGAIEHAIGSRDIEAMEGLVDSHPKLAGIVIAGSLSMLLPPFGVLIAKWAAIEASTAFPPAAVILAVGSAITTVFWVKWMGRVFSGGPSLHATGTDRLGIRYGLPLYGLLGLAVLLSGLVGLLADTLVVPSLNALPAGSTGLTTAAAALEAPTGSFPTWPLFLGLSLAILLPLFVVRAKPAQVRPVYACGEGIEENGKLVFRGAGDQKLEVSTGAYYLDGLFGEAKLVRPSNAIAIVLLVVLVGVACL